jgi:VWFA-related protein
LGQTAAPIAAVDENHKLVLDVVVSDKSGKAVQGLEEKDFTVLDNNQPQKLLSFRAMPDGVVTATSHAEPPTKVLILIDEVNTNYDRVAYERAQIKNFLLQNGGKLPYPTSFAFFSDTGTQMLQGYSQDGNALLTSYNQHETGLRSLRRSAGFYGAIERLQLSLDTLASLANTEAQMPGRKIVIWISPGWPLMSGPRMDLTSKEHENLFASIVSMSAALRKARITLYSIDPLGVDDAGGFRTNYYEEFLKPVALARNTQGGNLALQVLASQTGGRVLNSSNDITGSIVRCVEDAGSFYTLTLQMAPAERPNEFHHIQVQVGRPGVTTRTRYGYYAQP